jgi:hypothetical protein
MTILMLLWLFLGVVTVYFALPDLQLALGKTGTPGTLTVVSCEALGKGRYDCKGSFQPDAGGKAIPVAASPDSSAGDVFSAQLTPEGDRAVKNGLQGVRAALTLPFLGVAVLGFLPYSVLYAMRIRRGRVLAVAVGVVMTVGGLGGAVTGLIAAVS